MIFEECNESIPSFFPLKFENVNGYYPGSTCDINLPLDKSR